MHTVNFQSSSNLEASKRRLTKVVATLKKTQTSEPLVLGGALADLGDVCLAQGSLEEAEQSLLEALEQFPQEHEKFTLPRSRVMRSLAKIYSQRQDFEMAKTFLSEAMAANIRRFGSGHHSVRETMADLQSVVAAMYSLRSA